MAVELEDLEALGMGPSCPDCGLDMDWMPCQAIGCEDGYYDGHEYDDPLWYDPGEMVMCEDCQSQGGWWYCSKCEKTFDPRKLKSETGAAWVASDGADFPTAEGMQAYEAFLASDHGDGEDE